MTKDPAPRTDTVPKTREGKLKAALKANLAKRKAQTKSRKKDDA